MTRWLSSFIASLRRDQPDRPLAEQMRDLWRLPPGWTLPQTAKRVPNKLKVVNRNERKVS